MNKPVIITMTSLLVLGNLTGIGRHYAGMPQKDRASYVRQASLKYMETYQRVEEGKLGLQLKK